MPSSAGPGEPVNPSSNPLVRLESAGQSVWLDFIERKMLKDGGFRRMIDQDGLRGVTSNPAIFEKAIGESDDYDTSLAAFFARGDTDLKAAFEHLAIADIQDAADQLAGVYARSNGRDGFASLEVSPYLADDVEGTVREGRRLWAAVGRPNLMIKVPATPAGVAAVRELVGEGISVNVTLLFSRVAYLAAVEAHNTGLEMFRAKGGDIAKVAGVASVFVSRIDAEIDKTIEARLSSGGGQDAEALKALRGQVAIANAKAAYRHYLTMVNSPRWQSLAQAGAAPQRLLWASTGTKNPDYSDVLYVEALIGPDTVNTMPPKTMDAFRDHGVVRQALTENIAHAARVLAEVDRLGLDLDAVTGKLLRDGVQLFTAAADSLARVLADKRARL